MKVNREKLMELLLTNYDGSYAALARDLEVSAPQLHRYLTTGVGGGSGGRLWGLL